MTIGSNDQTTLASHYISAYEDNLMLVPQQKEARLITAVDAVLKYPKTGDRFNLDDMGTSDPEEIDDRFGPSPEGTVDKERRVGHFSAYDDGKFLDDIDTAKSLSDPANATMQAMQAGHMRFRDKKILQAMLGSAYSGRDGLTAVPYDTTNQRVARNDWTFYDAELTSAPSGNVGLTVAKLLNAKVKLDRSEMEGENYIYASAFQIGQLLRDKSVRNIQTNDVKALVAGEINHFMGFTFIRGELAPYSAGVRSVPCWKKQAVAYRGKTLTEAQIVRRSDRKFNWYAYYKGMHAAGRRFDQGVVEILCDES